MRQYEIGFANEPILYKAATGPWFIAIQKSPNPYEDFVVWLKFINWDDGVVGEFKTLAAATRFADRLIKVCQQS